MVALSKLYSLNDQRLAQISVKGDLIVGNDGGQIKTRSRSKQSMSAIPALLNNPDVSLGALDKDTETDISNQTTDPDQYTMVPAPLKIVKLLIDELLSASGARLASHTASAALANADLDSDDDDEGWEDDDDTLDMGLASTKADFMSFIDGPGRRQPDDETQSLLTEFFLSCGRENSAGFQDWYNMLNQEEQTKLNELAGSAGQ